MKVSLFEFDFSRFDAILLTLVPAIINLGIAIYVFSFSIKKRTTTYFSIFVLLLGIWQIEEGLMRMSINKDGAESWYQMGTR